MINNVCFLRMAKIVDQNVRAVNVIVIMDTAVLRGIKVNLIETIHVIKSRKPAFITYLLFIIKLFYCTMQNFSKIIQNKGVFLILLISNIILHVSSSLPIINHNILYNLKLNSFEQL